MSTSYRASPVAVVLMSVLAGACAGGGGSGGEVGSATPTRTAKDQAARPVEVPFSSFDAIRPNQIAVMSGVSQAGSGTDTAFNLEPADSANSSVALTYDANGNLVGASMSAPGSGAAFDASNFVVCSAAACSGTDGTFRAVVLNPSAFGWNYQSFGVWMNDPSTTTFQAGAISAGAATLGSALPTLSTGTFTGIAVGYYFDGAGGRFATDSQMRAVADFANRNVRFSTNLTTLTDLNAPWDGQTPRPSIAKPELNLSGTLSYAPGVNRISGELKTQNQALSGSALGRFYGPSAQEIGGTYGLGSADGQKMLGGFGGKR